MRGMMVFVSSFPVLLFLGTAATGAEFGGKARVETDNFIVMAYDIGVARKVGRDIERRRGEISRALGIADTDPWRPRCRVYIHDNWTAYRRESGGPYWSEGYAQHVVQRSETPGRNGSADKVVRAVFMFEKDSYEELVSVLSHELAHLIFGDALGPCPKIPLWLNEGVAVSNQGDGLEDYRKLVKRKVKSGSFIPLSILFSEGKYPEERKLFYAESASVVGMMLQTYGNVQFLTFARLAAKGVPVRRALNDAFSSFTGSVDEFEDEWKRYVIERH